MGEEIPTAISASDDQWHHVALTWSNTKGSYMAYKDGLLITQGDNAQKGKVSNSWFGSRVTVFWKKTVTRCLRCLSASMPR